MDILLSTELFTIHFRGNLFHVQKAVEYTRRIKGTWNEIHFNTLGTMNT